MSKKALLIITIMACICVAIVVTSVSTFAIWKEQADITESIPVEVPHFNASEEYIVFVGLDGTGQDADFVAAGTPDGGIQAYAVVGYTGLIEELEIPATHNGKPVTQIATHPQYKGAVRLASNSIVTEMKIPSSIIRIGVGACAGMPYLAKVTIIGNSQSLRIGDEAFAGCVNLTVFENKGNVQITGNAYSYLRGTPKTSA